MSKYMTYMVVTQKIPLGIVEAVSPEQAVRKSEAEGLDITLDNTTVTAELVSEDEDA